MSTNLIKTFSSYTHLIYTVKYAAYNYVSENVLKIKISVNLQNDNYSYVPKNGFFLKTFFREFINIGIK